MHPLDEIEALCRLLRDAAGEELLPRFARVQRRTKTDGSIVTTADTATQQCLLAELCARYPGIPLLGEEMDGDRQRRLLAEAPTLWCLDPLDGTSNFAAGIPYFAISLALIERGAAVLGIVYDPMREECFVARRGQGASLNGQPLHARGAPCALSQAMALVDFKRLPRALAVRLVAEAPYASQRSFGAVALDWCWLAAGRCQVYLHGRQHLWDYAAGQLIHTEAGGRSATLDGEAVFRLQLPARSAVAARDEALFAAWCRWLGVPLAG